MVKHGWPAKWRPLVNEEWAFRIVHDLRDTALPSDFEKAMQIAVRVITKTYRVDAYEEDGVVTFARPYLVTTGGHFQEVKP